MTHGVDAQRASGVVQRMSEDAAQLAQNVTNVLNTIAITRALQEGYRMACRDHGITPPEMVDPAAAYGLVSQQ